MSQKLSPVAVLIGTLRVNSVYSRIRKPGGIFIERQVLYLDFDIFSSLSI